MIILEIFLKIYFKLLTILFMNKSLKFTYVQIYSKHVDLFDKEKESKGVLIVYSFHKSSLARALNHFNC